MSDLISRQDAIDMLMERASNLRGIVGDLGGACSGAAELIMQLPPAQPKIGRWIHDGSKWTNRWICSECGYKWFFDCIEGAYCPNCGADMRGEHDG